MRNIFILLNVHFIVLDQNNSALIMILTAIIWSAKDSNYRWESLVTSPTMHLVTINLNLMSSNNRDEIVSAQDLFDWFESEFDGTLSLYVLTESNLSSFAVIHWIGPKKIA